MSDLSERIDGIEVKLGNLTAAQSKTNAEIMAKLENIEKLLSAKFNKIGWPVHEPTANDIISQVEARGGDLLEMVRSIAKKRSLQEKNSRRRKRA